MFSDFLYILEKKLYQLLREAFVALFFKSIHTHNVLMEAASQSKSQ